MVQVMGNDWFANTWFPVACVGINFYPAFGPLFRQLLPSDANPLL